MQSSRLHVTLLLGIVATLTVALTASASVASTDAGAQPQPTDTPIYKLDSLFTGQLYEYAEGALRSLRRDADGGGHINTDVTRCLDEETARIVNGSESHSKGHCVRTLKLSTREFDVTVGFVEDYPNHPGQMCVGSIEYDQRGFQSDPAAFVKAVRSLSSFGSPVPQSTPDNNLTTAVSSLYFKDAPTCRRENNCFTIADHCKIAPECAEVNADSYSSDDSAAAAYIKITANPYVTQQTAFFNVGTEQAREKMIPGFTDSNPLKGAADEPRCSKSAFLVPPQVQYALDERLDDHLTELTGDAILLPHLKFDPTAGALRLVACNTYVCLVEYLHTDMTGSTAEVHGFYHASGEWKPIWVLRGPCPLNFAELQDLINHHRPNDGWVEWPRQPQIRSCLARR